MILTDGNYSYFKQVYEIPDGWEVYRENFPFGKCAAFREYWTDGRGKWFHGEESIYIIDNTRFDTWEDLREYLREVWRPKAFDDQQWYMSYVAEKAAV